MSALQTASSRLTFRTCTSCVWGKNVEVENGKWKMRCKLPANYKLIEMKISRSDAYLNNIIIYIYVWHIRSTNKKLFIRWMWNEWYHSLNGLRCVWLIFLNVCVINQLYAMLSALTFFVPRIFASISFFLIIFPILNNSIIPHWYPLTYAPPKIFYRMYAIFRAFLVIVAALFCFSSSSNFQSQLKIVNFTYNFRVGQNAMRRRDRQGNKKKK